MTCMSERSKGWLAGGLLLGGALLVSLVAQGDAGGGVVVAREPAGVRTSRVEAGMERPSTPFPGRVQAVDRTGLTFGVAGRLTHRPVRLGDRIERGTLVARLEAEDLRHGAESAESRRSEIQAELSRQQAQTSRVRDLFQRGAATREELETADAALVRLQAAVASAETALAEARRLQDESSLVAPFAGTVVAVGAEPGEWVAPGDTIVELAGDGPRELVLEIPSRMTAHLGLGEALRVATGPGTVQVVGEVTAVGEASAGPGSLVPIRVALPQEAPFRPGDAAVAEVPSAPVPSLRVPLVAVVDPAGDAPAVFRVRGATAERVEIRVRGWLGESVEVEGELAPGDEVVVAGQGGLLDGEPVVVIR